MDKIERLQSSNHISLQLTLPPQGLARMNPKPVCSIGNTTKASRRHRIIMVINKTYGGLKKKQPFDGSRPLPHLIDDSAEVACVRPHRPKAFYSLSSLHLLQRFHWAPSRAEPIDKLGQCYMSQLACHTDTKGEYRMWKW